MRVLHLCLACFYIDDAGYQENHLVRQHVDDGHDVMVIASTEVFDGKGGLSFAKPGNYLGSDGARVVRLPYTKWLPQKMGWKLRIHAGVYKLIEEFEPAAILFHGCAGNEIVTAAKYAADHPDVLFYVDSHEDLSNSARGFVSKYILHRLFYRNRLQTALPVIRKILCVNVESMEFVSTYYGVPKDRLEFYPLGGRVMGESEIYERRVRIRTQHKVTNDTFVFFQSGKMDLRKKLVDSLSAFSKLKGDNLRFWITGLLTEEVEQDLLARIQADERISFFGWKPPDELSDMLCGADVYLQPGTASATMQHALCCGCPVIINNLNGHKPYIASGAILVSNQVMLLSAMRDALSWCRSEKQEMALKFAKAELDYKKLSERILVD